MPIASAQSAQAAGGFVQDQTSRELIDLLSSGGDARITLDPETGLNRYLSAPYPRDVTAYASSTANDISAAAFAFLRKHGVPDDYGKALNAMRERIRGAYGLDEDVGVIFAPSGTDLEYVALYLSASKSHAGVHNMLLGADEVGSGCIHSAHGRYFADETALGFAVKPKQIVEGLGDVSLTDIPLRCIEGKVRSSAAIAENVRHEMDVAAMDGRQALLHIVHGSKTGLILPALDDIDALRAEYHNRLSLVIDACQARITAGAISEYLQRDAIVFLTGSKFMGGPPFSGFALVPPALMKNVQPLPSDFAHIFRRAEWPQNWSGSDRLENSANMGLALRLSASIFELERFSLVLPERVEAIIASFRNAVFNEITGPLGLNIVESNAPGQRAEWLKHPIEMQTLITLDVSSLSGMRTFDEAQAMHKAMAGSGLRLGQSVKSVRTSGGNWAGTLRIGISMPQITAWAAMSEVDFVTELTAGMVRVAEALRVHSG